MALHVIFHLVSLTEYNEGISTGEFVSDVVDDYVFAFTRLFIYYYLIYLVGKINFML